MHLASISNSVKLKHDFSNNATEQFHCIFKLMQGGVLGQHTPTTDEYFISHGHSLPYFTALLEDRAQKTKNGWQKAAARLKRLAANLAAQARTFNSIQST